MFINLKVFAEHSQKIPASFLNSHSKRRDHMIPVYKIMSAYAIDLMIIMAIGSYLSFSTSVALLNFIPLSVMPEDPDFLSLFPLITLLYYSIANFFNGGQSFGMYKLNFRTPVHAKSYWEMLKWSSFSTMMILSFGSLAFFTRKKMSAFQNHDYLYEALTSYKESAVINLLEEIEKKDVEDIQREYFELAA